MSKSAKSWRKTIAPNAKVQSNMKQEEEPKEKRPKGRPPKIKKACTWCREKRLRLPYVFPCVDGKKKFCSESCLAEFSKANRTRKSSENGEQPEKKTKKKEKVANEDCLPLKLEYSLTVIPSVNSSKDSKFAKDRRESDEVASQPATPTKDKITLNLVPEKKPSVPVLAEKEAATSTTQFSVELGSDPNQWSIENVIQFISNSDQQLSDHAADLFRKHEIDGRAFLLLNFDMMMKYMGLKLGPAVKICNMIKKVTKNRRT